MKIIVYFLTLLLLNGCVVNNTKKYENSEEFIEACAIILLAADAIEDKSKCNLIINKKYFIIAVHVVNIYDEERYGEICAKGNIEDPENAIEIYSFWEHDGKIIKNIPLEYKEFSLDELRTMCRYD